MNRRDYETIRIERVTNGYLIDRYFGYDVSEERIIFNDWDSVLEYLKNNPATESVKDTKKEVTVSNAS